MTRWYNSIVVLVIGLKPVWKKSRKYNEKHLRKALELVRDKLEVNPTNTFKKGRFMNIILRLARYETDNPWVVKVLNDRPYIWKKTIEAGLLRGKGQPHGVYKFYS